MQYCQTILQSIGDTPLVRIHSLAKGMRGILLAKVEYMNPGHSVKDRVALYMVEQAEKKGLLKKGSVIVEPTSGNTGVGLALVAAIKGYDCVFTISDKQSSLKIDMLRALGARVEVCPSEVSHDHPDSYWSTAKRLVEEIPHAVCLDQYNNFDNYLCHYHTTGPEIWRDTEGCVTHYVSGMGTGGSLCGAGAYLKSKNSRVKVLGVDPKGSMLKKYVETGSYAEDDIACYQVEGIGSDFLPDNVKRSGVDEVLEMTDREAALMTRMLAKEEALFVGWSSGGIAHAALKYAKEHLQEKDVMVILLPDHGSRYIQKVYNDDWIREAGY